MEGIAQKVRAIIEKFNLNNYSFSKRIGVTSTTIDSIINGRLSQMVHVKRLNLDMTF